MTFPDFMFRPQKKNPYELVPYSDDIKEKVFDFLSKAFMDAGKKFELESRHKIYKDIQKNFILFLCMMDADKLIGTVALKNLDEASCELKAMYLLKDYQGKKLGHKLAVSALDFARKKGFKQIYLDSMKQYDRALRLYKSLGFKETERYNDNDKADVFMVMDL